MIYIPLINNITLLISLSIVHSILLNKWRLGFINFKIFSGFLFGFVAIAGMINSLEILPGVFFDGRSIILAMAGAFGGPVSAAIAVIISGAYRFYVGGGGALMGILVIVCSALLGLIIHFYMKRNEKPIHPATFYILGLAVHVNMLVLLVTLPGGIKAEVFSQIAIPILVIYPLGTLLMAWLFQTQEKHIKTVVNLKESEKRFRQIFDNSLAVNLLIDPEDASIWDANQAAIDFYGWPLAVLKTMTMHQINTLGAEEVKRAIARAKMKERQRFTFKHRVANGEVKDVEIISGPMVINKKTLLLSIIQDITEKNHANDAFNRERTLLRTLIDNIPDRVSVKDIHERRILTNLSELLFLGKSHEEICQKKDVELFDGPLGMQMEADDKMVLQSGHAIINKEEKLPGSNGHPVWMLSSRIPLRDELNQIIGLVSISRDITQRKLAEEQIRTLSLVAEQTSNLVVISNNNDEIIWVNASFLKKTGYALEEVIGKTVGGLLQGPGTDPLHVKNMADNMARKIAFKQEILNYTKSGEEIWLEVFVNPVLDLQGNIQKIIAISMDITERKHSEILLQQSIKSYSDLFNSLGEGIYIQDERGSFLDISAGALEMSGYSMEELIGKNPEFIAQPGQNDFKKINELFLKAFNGQPQNLEFQARTKTGKVFPMEVHLYPGEHFSQKVVLAITQDITQRKQSEELRNSLEVATKTTKIKQQFLANVSHEMRTPMNGVLGMTEILKKTTLDDTQLRYLHIIEDSSRSMLEIINDVLQLSKIEAGKQEIIEKLIHTDDFTQRIHSLFSHAAQSKNLEFSVFCDETVPASFLSDENKILQIINNLLGNAIKFTSRGFVRIRFEGFVDREQKEMIRVWVEDSGKGISLEYHGKIFEEFAQVDVSPTRETGGTGLGLAISKRMVQFLGGSIGLNSHPGKGSAFWFTFSYRRAPVARGLDDVVLPKTPVAENLVPGFSVLLVEDKKVNQIVAKLMLQEMGCLVDIAENGLKAIERVQQKKYEVIFMDIQMPVMDGVTAVQKLRAMNISLPEIIGLSAEAMEGDAEKYIALGMDDYLTKPIDSGLLQGKLLALQAKNGKPF